jgi:PAS domain S-box-containing protein
MMGSSEDQLPRLAAVRREAERFRGLLDTAPYAIVTVDERGVIGSANAEAERLFGYARRELIGQRVEVLVPERDRGRHKEHRQAFAGQLHARRLGVGRELMAPRKDGTEFQAEIGLGRLESDDGVLFSCVITDISERKRTEAALARLAAIVESSDDAILGMTLDGTITDWNPGAQRIYGYSASEVAGRHARLLCPGETQQRDLERILGVVAAGGRVSITVSPIRNRDGHITGASAVARDVTERKRAIDALAGS